MSSYLYWCIPMAQVLVNKRNTFERPTNIQRCFPKHNGRKQDEVDRKKFSVHLNAGDVPNANSSVLKQDYE